MQFRSFDEPCNYAIPETRSVDDIFKELKPLLEKVESNSFLLMCKYI